LDLGPGDEQQKQMDKSQVSPLQDAQWFDPNSEQPHMDKLLLKSGPHMVNHG
jgi:hypothetical protein